MSRTAYFNGNIYTADSTAPRASAFVVEDGVFMSVGDASVIHDCDNRVDLKGRCVIPGLIESHAHMVSGCIQENMHLLLIRPDIEPNSLGAALRNALQEEGPESLDIVRAMGADFSRGSFTARDIDFGISDLPVFLFSQDGHSLLMNSRAIELTQIDESTPDPGSGSYFERDDSGRPTGMVVEIPAMSMIKKFFIPRSSKKLTRALLESIKDFSRFGFTTGFDAATISDEDISVLDMLRKLEKASELPMRIFTSACYYGEAITPAAELVEMMKRLYQTYSCDLIHPTTLKLILDGTVENHTALLNRPYCDEADNIGNRLLEYEDMQRAVTIAAANGFNVHIHAIGDRAVYDSIRALSCIRGAGSTKTIAHNQLYDPKSIDLILQNKDIFFQTTPYWTKNDDFTKKALGEKRYALQYPIGTMVRNGIRVTFGSDSLDGDICKNPFAGMFFAVWRGINEDDFCCPPKSEGITLQDAFCAYTINGAMQLNAQDTIGSITAGKDADFVILDRDIFDIPVLMLPKTKVEETFLKGKCVYRQADVQ